MVKTKEIVEVDDSKKELAVVDLESFQGEGMESVGLTDMAIPFIKLLQAGSPEVKKSKPEYVEEAVAGDFYNPVSGIIYKTLRFVPCYYQFVVNEWKPDRGGYVGTHKKGSDIENRATRLADGSLVTETGNNLVDTANWFVLTDDGEAGWNWGVISFTSTQLKKSRRLMSQIQGVKLDGSNGPFTPPLFAHMVEAEPLDESNDKGDWIGWKLTLDKNKTCEDANLFALAKEYCHQVKSGLVKAVPPQDYIEDEPVY